MANIDYIKIEEFQKGIDELERGYDSVLNYLYNINNGNAPLKEKQEFVYFQVDELAYENNVESLEEVIYALYATEISLSVVFKSVNGELRIYLGTQIELISTLYNILNGSFWVTSAQMEEKDDLQYEFLGKREVFDRSYLFSGIIRGGIKKRDKDAIDLSVIDSLMSGVRGENFSIVIVAKPLGRHDVITLLNDWSELKTRGEIIRSRQVSLHDDLHSVSYTDISHKVMNYIEIIDKLHCSYKEALGKGLWECTIKYFADSEMILKAVSGIIISKLFSEDAAEVIHCIKMDYIEFNDDLFVNRVNVEIDNGPEMQFPLYSSFINSDELSVVTELPKVDTIGVPVRENVRFDLAQKQCGNLVVGKILQSRRMTNKFYTLDVNELNRHALVVGLTGSGKTNTLKNILLELKKKQNIPFLIVEPAKKEYWELYKLDCDDLTIYSFSDDNMLYINPFQKVGTVTVQMHIDYLFAAFKASFIMYPPMPYVLERALYSIYSDCGWDIAQNTNVLGEIYPTIEQLYHKIPVVVEEMGYDIREQKNIVGALQARINSLRLGTKGQCLNVKESTKIEEILGQNTVIELEGIADEEAKAFIMSLIMVQLMEFRINEKDSQKELKHLFLMEEAHRLLKNIPSGTGENADPRGNAVEMFCNMLAELRSKGQGFIIADQIPSKLAPDIIKNTNLKILHRIVAEEDRNLMGKCMHMNDIQIDFVSNLMQGQGIIYSENDNEPKMILSTHVDQYFDEDRIVMLHEEILELCRPQKNYIKNEKEKTVFCAICPFKCDGEKSKKLYDYLDEREFAQYVNELRKGYDEDVFVVIISESLLNIRDSIRDKEDLWKYAFCIANEITDLLAYSEEWIIKVFPTILNVISCMNGTPKQWEKK